MLLRIGVSVVMIVLGVVVATEAVRPKFRRTPLLVFSVGVVVVVLVANEFVREGGLFA
jgi:hypothetical protein